LQCFRFQFFTEREIVGGRIDERDTTSDDDDFARLEDIFEKCQKEKATGLLLRILDYTIACAPSYSTWHARNLRGMVDEKGSSVVLKFDNFNALIYYIRSFVEALTFWIFICSTPLKISYIAISRRCYIYIIPVSIRNYCNSTHRH